MHCCCLETDPPPRRLTGTRTEATRPWSARHNDVRAARYVPIREILPLDKVTSTGMQLHETIGERALVVRPLYVPHAGPHRAGLAVDHPELVSFFLFRQEKLEN